MQIQINLSDYAPEVAQAILAALSKAMYGGAKEAPAPAPVPAPPPASVPAPPPPPAEQPPVDAAVQQAFPGAQEITLDMARTEMRKYMTSHSKAEGQAVLYKHGVRKLTDADPMVLAQIYEEVRGDAG